MSKDDFIDAANEIRAAYAEDLRQAGLQTRLIREVVKGATAGGSAPVQRKSARVSQAFQSALNLQKPKL